MACRFATPVDSGAGIARRVLTADPGRRQGAGADELGREAQGHDHVEILRRRPA